MNPKDPESVDADGFNGQNLSKYGEGFSETPQTQQPQPPQPHKKQVRRRFHTSRPYQERLLNMAEARREIITALKFHRAAMKQANVQKRQQQQQRQQQEELQQQQLSQPSHLSSPPPFEQESKIKSGRNPRIYPSSTNNFSSYNLDKFSYSSFSQHNYPPHPNPCSWPASPFPLRPATDALNFTLPNQTIGLNLNLHDFNNIDGNLCYNSNNPSIYSSSSPSSSSSPTLSVVTEEVPSVALAPEVGPTAMADLTESYCGGGLHHGMGDEEMAEIRSLGEQHQMEWNDAMNLVTSAWWFKFLKTMELGPEVKVEDDGYQPFDQVMEFPAWLNANDSCLQQHFNDVCPDDYFQDPALPCMDIGEIEGMDGEWLA
ncbi:cytoplasmic polyadenylation element-binding protein-like [Durio zibethinus]|uniref:Cytoplasmic polyadenylation element-binding protein-like n=1 Tax=Durio zibethinus TaxID=66656 RepID=A0A6P5ZP64_DURZI|nr:cytoplasmic polyadenylation element-binding protein-like [Durio zibethinus]